MTLGSLIIANGAIAAALVYALLHLLAHALYSERRLATSRTADTVTVVDDVAIAA
ncbi:MAG: hypothetical protein ACTHKS_06525 [Gaiellaceae bacterium]